MKQHDLKPRSAVPMGAACSLLIVLLAMLDWAWAPRISFSLFYLLLVAFAAWSGDRRTGLWTAVAGVLAWFAHELRIAPNHALSWPLFWNLGVQAGIIFSVALLVSAVRELTQNLERRVKNRTRELEHEILERKQTEEQLQKTMQQFRQLAENITDAFWMREANETRMVYVSPAYEYIWGRSCRELYQSPQAWLEAVHPEDRPRVEDSMHIRQPAGEWNQDYRILRPDGALRWIRERAFPIRDSSGRIIRIVGIAEDVTERRRMEREILEISDREQARIGQDLHDSLCQKLVSLAFDNAALEQKLSTQGHSEAKAVQQMGMVLDDAITEARAVSRGLFPVQLETDGLQVALQQLAASVSSRTRVECRVQCPQPVPVRNNATATHLYRIAQEAVNNAVKHGAANSILIELHAREGRIDLSITDDGVGIPAQPNRGAGMGLHTMDYRARTIGGVLTVARGPNRGTVVSCSVPQQTT